MKTTGLRPVVFILANDRPLDPLHFLIFTIRGIIAICAFIVFIINKKAVLNIKK